MGTDAIFMDDNARRIEHDWCGVIWRVKPFHSWRNLLDHDLCGTCWESGLQVAVCSQAPYTSSSKPYYRNGHYCHNKRSTTLLLACLAFVEHAFQLERIIPVISVWFPLHILPTNLGCRTAKAVIYVFLFVFALLFVMWSINTTPTTCTTFSHIH
ncbi:hypothetical protein AVEN_256277-1 [Araneus ventricosus]|uniref:Uncharacterized protein n=1 Tax=Araneus ventricosus TaxID=182803 RepID=A0A4Y2U8D6_ARAVE|nr:hypothetical protein AVEN_256277-1 [Araneus ventricosus]